MLVALPSSDWVAGCVSEIYDPKEKNWRFHSCHLVGRGEGSFFTRRCNLGVFYTLGGSIQVGYPSAFSDIDLLFMYHFFL